MLASRFYWRTIRWWGPPSPWWYGRWKLLSNTTSHPEQHQNPPNISLLGKEIVELRSPDLWGVQSDAEFYARFAHEGPEVVRSQFGG